VGLGLACWKRTTRPAVLRLTKRVYGWGRLAAQLAFAMMSRISPALQPRAAGLSGRVAEGAMLGS